MIKKSKIIRNYKISNELKKTNLIPKVIKNASIEKDVEIPTKTKVKQKEIKIEEVKNKQDILVGIRIHCKCGQVIDIEFDYE